MPIGSHISIKIISNSLSPTIQVYLEHSFHTKFNFVPGNLYNFILNCYFTFRMPPFLASLSVVLFDVTKHHL